MSAIPLGEPVEGCRAGHAVCVVRVVGRPGEGRGVRVR